MENIELGDLESEIIGNIYDAALNQQLWKGVLQKIRDSVNANECTIFFYDAQCRTRNYAAAATMGDDIVEHYLKEYIDHEAAAINENFKHIPSGTIVIPPQMEAITGETYEETMGEEYSIELRPKQELRAGSALIHGKIISSAMGIHCSAGSPYFSQEKIEFLDRIVSHMSKAMHIHNHVTSIEKTNQGIQETLRRINVGVFLLDKEARVVYSNPEAARILESSNTLTIGRGGQLYLADDADNTQLQILVNDLIQSGFKSDFLFNQGLHLAAHNSEQTHPLKLSLIPVRHSDVHSASDEHIEMMILVNDPSRPYVIPQSYLEQAYGLTETECTIVQSLLNNLSINDISEERETTVETTRGQLKNIMQKTSTHSQAELSRLLMALSGDFNNNT